MSTGTKWRKIGTALLLSSALLCAGMPIATGATSGPGQRKTAKKKKQPELPPLPSGPTGRPVPPVPLDAIAAVPPQVTYENNQLTIIAPNSTLAEILRAVRKQTGAEIDVPAAPERVVTRIGPGPARDVIAELLNGSRFNYVLLGSPTDGAALTRVVLVAKTGPQEITPNPASPPQNAAFAGGQPNNPPEAEAAPEANEGEAADENNADDNADQQPPPEAEQQTPAEQGAPGVKTPQQMLQEMQQRQMQMQQQGQPPAPAPGSGMQPHPPQEN